MSAFKKKKTIKILKKIIHKENCHSSIKATMVNFLRHTIFSIISEKSLTSSHKNLNNN